MKLLTTIHKLENANKLLKEASGLVIGLKAFSTRETSYLTIDEFEKISELTKNLNKELYISLKPLLFNSSVDSLTTVFEMIKDFYYTGVIVGDIGYYYLLKELKIKNIIYNPETLLTNIEDFNSYFEIGINGAFVAKEINLSDVILISENKKGRLFINAHGHLNMFYSKRMLLESYFNNIKFDYDFKNKTTLTLKEKTRDLLYPIIEDNFGTHIFRGNVSTVIRHLDDLKGVDYLLIDSMFKDDLYALDILRLFQEGYNENKVLELEQKYNEKWDDGFLNLKTIYKRNE